MSETGVQRTSDYEQTDFSLGGGGRKVKAFWETKWVFKYKR